jgi:hypothetical protein
MRRGAAVMRKQAVLNSRDERKRVEMCFALPFSEAIAGVFAVYIPRSIPRV